MSDAIAGSLCVRSANEEPHAEPHAPFSLTPRLGGLPIPSPFTFIILLSCFVAAALLALPKYNEMPTPHPTNIVAFDKYTRWFSRNVCLSAKEVRNRGKYDSLHRGEFTSLCGLHVDAQIILGKSYMGNIKVRLLVKKKF